MPKMNEFQRLEASHRKLEHRANELHARHRAGSSIVARALAVLGTVSQRLMSEDQLELADYVATQRKGLQSDWRDNGGEA